MKQNRIRIIQELLITQINFMMFYPLCLSIATLFESNDRPSLLIWMLGGLAIFAMYFIRVNTKNFFVLILLHGVCLGALFMLAQVLSPADSSINKNYFILVGIGFVVYSIYLRLNTPDFEDHCASMPFAVGFVAVALFIQHYQNNTKWDTYCKIVLIMIIALYFLNYYLHEYLNFLIVNASSTGILPEKEIFSSGMRLTFLYTLGGVIILICTSQISWLKTILSKLKQIIVSIISFISSLFPDKAPGPTEILTDEKSGGGVGFEMEPGEPAMIWYIIGGIAVIALIIVILASLYMALRRFIDFISKMMQKNVYQHKEVEVTSAVDVREKCEIKKSSSRKSKPLEFLGFLDAKEKIRRIYKKKAYAYKPNPLAENKPDNKKYLQERLPFYTAREMEREMEAGAFAEIYEKARYSNEACTSQDVKLMKEFCR